MTYALLHLRMNINKRPGKCAGPFAFSVTTSCKERLPVFAQNAQDTALDGYLRGGNIDGIHLNVGRL